MEIHRRNLEGAVRAIAIHSPGNYSWFGKPFRLPVKLRRALNDDEVREYLLHALTLRLYNDFYIRGTPMATTPEANTAASADPAQLVVRLSAANSGNGCREAGWKVRVVRNGTAAVVRDGLTIWIPMQDERLLPEESPISPEADVQVRLPKEFLGMSPGFYMALGDRPLTRGPGGALIRIYWNVWPRGAIPFVRTACGALNRASVPFRLKVVNDPSLFTRCDGGVIYILGGTYDAIGDALGEIYRDVADYLKPGVPAFTKQLAPGVGLAEDPGNGESFGQHRCRLLADGVIRSCEEGKGTAASRIRFVADFLEASGVRLAQPFLNPGSRDEYGFIGGLPRVTAGTPRGTVPGARDFLDVADELGRRLSKEAIWHGEQCNWLGAELVKSDPDGIGSVYEPLNSDLYSGTSGVALFLAELYAANGSGEMGRAAAGAIRHALRHLPKTHGLYTGLPGVIFAAARVGAILKEDEFLDCACRWAREYCGEPEEGGEFDLLSGRAGTIAGLLLIREILHDETLLDVAERIADELLAMAEDSHGGYSWRSPTHHWRHNLTGLSHGTAGVGYAFLELFRAVRKVKYRAAAERAFEYERHWFDAEEGNWPDFRDGQDSGGSRARRHFAAFWCHGAPGIGLTRLRAYDILGDPRWKEEGTIALNTTHERLRGAFHTGMEDFSLCHGLAGNAEILLSGRHAAGPEWAKKSVVALEIAASGIDLLKRQGGSFRCGIACGETPALMTGLAGIGYFYLRLYDSGVPSILMPCREQFRTR